MAVQISFSVKPTSLVGDLTPGRILVRGWNSSMNLTVSDQSCLFFVGRTISPPALPIFSWARSEVFATIILSGWLIAPFPSSFWYPAFPRSTSSMLPACFADPSSINRSNWRTRSLTLIALVIFCLTGWKPLLPIWRSYRITADHLCRFQPALPCPPSMPESRCWPERPHPWHLEPLSFRVFLFAVVMAGGSLVLFLAARACSSLSVRGTGSRRNETFFQYS